MNQASGKRRVPLVGILAACLFCLMASVVAVFVATASVTGSATLPNGSNVGITAKRGFGVSSNGGETRIEAGGYVVEVDDNLVLSVNGSEMGKLDEEPKRYDLTVDAEGLQIRCAERIVAQVR